MGCSTTNLNWLAGCLNHQQYLSNNDPPTTTIPQNQKVPTLKEKSFPSRSCLTASLPLNNYRIPIEKACLPTIHFSGGRDVKTLGTFISIYIIYVQLPKPLPSVFFWYCWCLRNPVNYTSWYGKYLISPIISKVFFPPAKRWLFGISEPSTISPTVTA